MRKMPMNFHAAIVPAPKHHSTPASDFAEKPLMSVKRRTMFAPLPATGADWGRVYSIKVTHDALAPRAMPGEEMYFDPNAPLAVDQLVAVWIGGTRDPASRLIGVARKMTPKSVMLALTLDDNRPLRVERATAEIHPCVGIGFSLVTSDERAAAARNSALRRAPARLLEGRPTKVTR